MNTEASGDQSLAKEAMGSATKSFFDVRIPSQITLIGLAALASMAAHEYIKSTASIRSMV